MKRTQFGSAMRTALEDLEELEKRTSAIVENLRFIQEHEA
jgi:hypothetical protein